ncbi:P-loop containing nucleoside triphosphate hydrolase protein [Aspergillus alliaceus]|uniref:P-loop containing nucleoside triphosphate hydrolase protein n=1 Tax=Petromyces alliaceus TaxID=209559 RepID=A0A5N7CHE7_PETAA|nr:P-loop containing nucleoside triphosphate hydrolase protein [Aspergillus alliaceus]
MARLHKKFPWVPKVPQLERHWGQCIRTREGHSDDTTQATISNDGRLIASASDDYTLQIRMMGVCGFDLVEELVKIPIKQFSYWQVTNAASNHVMKLSIDFHLDSDSAEIMNAIEQGESLTNLLETVEIDTAPTFVDLLIAYASPCGKFNAYTSRHGGCFNGMHICRTVQGWQTVSYFNRFTYERNRFHDAVEAHLTASENRSQRDACIKALTEFTVPVTFFILVPQSSTKSPAATQPRAPSSSSSNTGDASSPSSQQPPPSPTKKTPQAPRLDASSESITIDDHNIRNVSLSSLRESLGVFLQDPLLFNSTIIEKLRYARPSATDEETFSVGRAAAIHEKILTFAKGYEMRVRDQGYKLSGGELQRVAIARVVLKDPPVFLLDGATSAVDPESESEIQGALEMARRRATFVISTSKCYYR